VAVGRPHTGRRIVGLRRQGHGVEQDEGKAVKGVAHIFMITVMIIAIKRVIHSPLRGENGSPCS
jgi:hypothetical protein